MSVFPESVRSVRGAPAWQGVLRAVVTFLFRLFRRPKPHDDLLRAGQSSGPSPCYLTASFGQRPMH